MLGITMVVLAAVLVAPAQAQPTPLLRLTTIQVVPGNPVQFTFSDAGTGATNYAVEFSPALGAATGWSNLTAAVITPLGGGSFVVQVPGPMASQGFFRVRGEGGSAGVVTASFSTTAFQVTEGGMVAPVITFSAPFFGTVRYTIGGTATTGDYTSLSGQVFVSGTSATIPVSMTDNEVIGQLKYLTLTLEAGPGLQPGTGSEATINILENDAEWQGSFKTDATSIGFVLKIQESNGVKMASLNGDGLGLLPTNEVPANLMFTPDDFVASIAGIPVAATATLLNEPMNLSLFLGATNGVTDQSVSATQVEGTATLVSAVPAKPFLNTTNVGAFLLLKPPVTPSTNQVPLASQP